MGKLLEKALRDAVKEDRCTIGAKQVAGAIKGSKMIVLSRLRQGNDTGEITRGAEEAGVPTVSFEGSSVALGRLCGLQYRVSAISIDAMPEAGIKPILEEAQ
ncbi:ribosomal protein L30E [Cenarchaeum symbiosum A]|uniref:Ribosomal protein L30E n=1 Tax=Cenarchaeum symbiosum (strain A) TaxID=414004 RepID=A0RUR4_CENSY|nr:ribosomal protein L30E [Cenarchaeum symbiosum A]